MMSINIWKLMTNMWKIMTNIQNLLTKYCSSIIIAVYSIIVYLSQSYIKMFFGAIYYIFVPGFVILRFYNMFAKHKIKKNSLGIISAFSIVYFLFISIFLNSLSLLFYNTFLIVCLSIPLLFNVLFESISDDSIYLKNNFVNFFKNKGKNYQQAILKVLFIFILCIPTFFLVMYRFADQFLYITMQEVIAISKNGYLINVKMEGFSSSSLYSGYPLLIYSAHVFYGVSLECTPYIPLGSIVFLLLINDLGNDLNYPPNTNRKYKWLLLLFYAWDPTSITGVYSVFAYAWSRIFLFFYIFVARKYVLFKETKDYVLLSLIVLACNITYWTTGFFLLGIHFLVTLYILYNKFRNKNKLYLSVTLIILVFLFMVLFFLLIIQLNIDLNVTFFREILNFSINGNSTQKFSAKKNMMFYVLLVRSSIIVILLVEICAFLLIFLLFKNKFDKIKKERQEKKIFNELIFGFLFVLLPIIQFLAYAVLKSHFSTRFFTILAPFGLILLISTIQFHFSKFSIVKRNIFTFTFVLLVFSSITGMIFFGCYLKKPPSASAINEITNFLAEKTYDNTSKIIADMNLWGLIALNAHSKNLSVEYLPINEDIYEFLVNWNFSSIQPYISKFDYFIINFDDRNVNSVGWRQYMPFIEFQFQIQSNPYLENVYSIECYYIYLIQL